VIARIVADRLTQVWTQQVLVINRPGGGGIIAAQAAATSEPDGYTLLFGLASTFVVLPETHDKFDPHRAFVPISLLSEQPFLVAAASMLGVNTLADVALDPLIQPAPVSCQILDDAQHARREDIAARRQDARQLGAQETRSLPHRNPSLQQERADLIDDAGPRNDGEPQCRT